MSRDKIEVLVQIVLCFCVFRFFDFHVLTLYRLKTCRTARGVSTPLVTTRDDACKGLPTARDNIQKMKMKNQRKGHTTR